MSRVFSHQWRDKRPFTRRVRWLCASWTERDKDIRLEFEDQDGVVNRFYGDDKARAEKDYDDFKKGLTSTLSLRQSNQNA